MWMQQPMKRNPWMKYSNAYSVNCVKYCKLKGIERNKYTQKAFNLAWEEHKSTLRNDRLSRSQYYDDRILYLPIELYYKHLKEVKGELDYDLHDLYFDRDDDSEVIERQIGEQWIDHGVLVECCEVEGYENKGLLEKCSDTKCHFRPVSQMFWRNCKLKCCQRSDNKVTFAKRIRFQGEENEFTRKTK